MQDSRAPRSWGKATPQTGIATLAIFGLAALPQAANAQGTLYNFEVQSQNYTNGYGGTNTNYTGPGQLGTGTTATWNVVTQGSPNVTGARDSLGNASSVVFTSGVTSTFNGYNENNSSSPDQLLSNFANGSDNHLSFTGLAPNTAFVLDLYGINGGNDQLGGGSFNSRGTIFTLTDSTYTTPLQASKTTINQQDTTFVAGDNYVQFSGVTDATGSVYATYYANGYNGNGEPDFNGAQLQVMPAPEPSSVAAFAFTGLSAAGLILRAWGRSPRTGA